MKLIKEMKKILCCFIVICAAFATSGIFGVTSTYGEIPQLVIGENKEFTTHSNVYWFKFVPDKTGVYDLEASTDEKFFYIAYISVYNSDYDKLGSLYKGGSFYALEGNTYYIEFVFSPDYSSSYEAGYSVKYTFSLEKEMECIPCFDCRVTCDDKDLLAEGDNFKFDSKTLTLEIKDYKGKAPSIRIIDINNIGIIYDLKDVHSDNVYFNIKITGNNTLVINSFSWDLNEIGKRSLAIRFVGNGVLNLKNNENNSTLSCGLEAYGRDMVIDGPIINISDKSTNVSLINKPHYHAVQVDGNFEMISGELNIDSKYNGLEVHGNAAFKGGKININISESDNTPAISVGGEGNFEGTDINIDVKGIETDIFNPTYIISADNTNYISGTLSVKADEYVDVIHTNEFNMTGGSINADLSASGLVFGDIIYARHEINLEGGDFIIKYNLNNLPDDVSGYILVSQLGSLYYSEYSSGKLNIDNIQIVLVTDNEKMKQIIEQSDIDSPEKLFEFDKNDTINIGKNINIIIRKEIDINKLGIKLLEESFIYDGTEKKPKLDLRGLREGIDVEVTYSDNVNAGEGKVIVKGKGDYTGTVTFKFSIKAKDENVAKKDNNTKNNTETSIFDDGRLIYKIVKPAGKKYGKVSVIGLKKKSLKKINIKASVKHAGLTYKITSIGANAFKNNKKIISVIIGKNVTKIDKKAFYNCKKLKKVIIKSVKLKKVGKKAYAKTSKNLVIKVASKKKKTYFKKLKKAGFKGKIK